MAGADESGEHDEDSLVGRLMLRWVYHGRRRRELRLPEGFEWDPTPLSEAELRHKPRSWSVMGRDNKRLVFRCHLGCGTKKDEALPPGSRRQRVYYFGSAPRDERCVGRAMTRGDLQLAVLYTRQATAYELTRDRSTCQLLSGGVVEALDRYFASDGTLLVGGKPDPLLYVADGPFTGSADATSNATPAPQPHPSLSDAPGTDAGGSACDSSSGGSFSAQGGYLSRKKVLLPEEFAWSESPLTVEEWRARSRGWYLSSGPLYSTLVFKRSRSSSGCTAVHVLCSIARPASVHGRDCPTRGDLEAAELMSKQARAYEASRSPVSCPSFSPATVAALDAFLDQGGTFRRSGPSLPPPRPRTAATPQLLVPPGFDWDQQPVSQAAWEAQRPRGWYLRAGPSRARLCLQFYYERQEYTIGAISRLATAAAGATAGDLELAQLLTAQAVAYEGSLNPTDAPSFPLVALQRLDAYLCAGGSLVAPPRRPGRPKRAAQGSTSGATGGKEGMGRS